MSAAPVDIEALASRVADLVVARLGERKERKLLNTKEAAVYMGVSVGALRHLIASEQVPPRAIRRYGRRVFLEKALFDQWLDAR